jgi:hypothetical protein
MINKRAQAALEFLTTYGWAFLVILIMIGALSYFGVFNVDSFIPESSNIGVGAIKGGNDFSIAYDSANTESILMLEFINDKDKDIVLDNIIISEASSGVEYVGIPSPTSIPSGFNGVIEVTFDDTVDTSLTSDFVGDKKRFDVQIFYNLVGSTIPAMVEGTITTTVQEEESSPTLTATTTVLNDGAEEGEVPVRFTISLNGVATSTISINYALSGDADSDKTDCMRGIDYLGTTPNSIDIGIGEDSAILTLTVCDGSTREDDEKVILTLSTGIGYILENPNKIAEATITDND